MKLVREHINEVLKIKAWTKDNPYKGNIDLYNKDLNILPNNIPKFISGDFYCSYNNLTTLEFAPKYVGESFYCNHNNLTSLEFAPEYVGESFSCSENKLTTLEFAPEYVGVDFYCYHNNIPKEEIERYWRTGAVKGRIISEHGNYEPFI